VISNLSFSAPPSFGKYIRSFCLWTRVVSYGPISLSSLNEKEFYDSTVVMETFKS
jgi:hypothetical protein